MGVGLCKRRGYENGVEHRNYWEGGEFHLEKDKEAAKRLTPHPDLAWCRDERGGRRCRSGVPSASTA